jgi:hypothetical protein
MQDIIDFLLRYNNILEIAARQRFMCFLAKNNRAYATFHHKTKALWNDFAIDHTLTP